MARRALLTEGEREALTDPESRDNPYVAVSRVRKKIQEELPRDVEILREHDSDLFDELREVVCEVENSEDIAAECLPDEERGRRSESANTLTVPEESDVEDALVDVEFPTTKDREDCIEAVRATYEFLQEQGSASMSEIVVSVMPEYSVGYDAEADVERINDPDERNRSTWWRNVVKPGLNALPDVESPPRGASEWRFTDDE